MPFGMGRAGWAYVHHWHHGWCHPSYSGPAPYGWLPGEPYWPVRGAMTREEEATVLQDEARALE